MIKIDLSKIDTKELAKELETRRSLRVEEIAKEFSNLLEECSMLGVRIYNENDSDYILDKNSFSVDGNSISYNETEDY